MNHLVFVSKACVPNFRLLAPFLHVKKFVVGGWWVGVKTWILVLSFKPKLNKSFKNIEYVKMSVVPDCFTSST